MLLSLGFNSSLYILDNSLLSHVSSANIFVPSYGFSSYSLNHMIFIAMLEVGDMISIKR